ncbi:MAG: lamin tail domain-containing protein [Bacteroidales bacterium]|nr:lamin tail domain-containing protein [Bacteroidales bacterium]
MQVLVSVVSSVIAQEAKDNTSDTSLFSDRDIVINEILFNPADGGFDYVELYNNSNKTLPLHDCYLAKVSGDSITKYYPIADVYWLRPKEYVVISENSQWVRMNYKVLYPEKLLEVSTMPAYANAKGNVVLALNNGTVIDWFSYTEKMHNPILYDREGVSLERRDVNAPTNSDLNWTSASSVSGFGTPTYKNSNSSETLFLENDIFLQPTLFSPDADGYDDLITLSYSLSRAGLVANITIFDKEGRIQKHLSRNETLGMEGSLQWDGLNDNGQPCSRGAYVMAVEVFDNNGYRQLCYKNFSLVRR